MKEVYNITLIGCDDVTRIQFALTKKEFELIEKICDKSREMSDYSCMPTMTIEKEKIDEEV
jgi:hypothetical protein